MTSTGNASAKPKGVTARDEALHRKHLRAGIRYNEAHARDHVRLAKSERAQLKKETKKR